MENNTQNTNAKKSTPETRAVLNPFAVSPIERPHRTRSTLKDGDSLESFVGAALGSMRNKKSPVLNSIHIDGRAIKTRAEPKDRTRVPRDGVSANHPYTLRMQQIKKDLHMTTSQLVMALNAFENNPEIRRLRKIYTKDYVPSVLTLMRPRVSESKREKLRERILEIESQGIAPISIDWSIEPPGWPLMKYELLASYLQGMVGDDRYMGMVLGRLERFYKSVGKSTEKPKSIRDVMHNWFDRLGIKYNKPDGSKVVYSSPTRELAIAIAPFFKRPVLIPKSGTFLLYDGFYMVDEPAKKKDIGLNPRYELNPKERVLIKHGTEVVAGTLVQWVRLEKNGKPSEDHTTFYRWYTEIRMPRSKLALDAVESAVQKAEKLKRK
jgi:hypothetical protein